MSESKTSDGRSLPYVSSSEESKELLLEGFKAPSSNINPSSRALISSEESKKLLLEGLVEKLAT